MDDKKMGGGTAKPRSKPKKGKTQDRVPLENRDFNDLSSASATLKKRVPNEKSRWYNAEPAAKLKSVGTSIKKRNKMAAGGKVRGMGCAVKGGKMSPNSQ